MIFKRAIYINKHVVNIGGYEFVQILSQDLVDIFLKGSGCFRESEKGNKSFI
jgi:hypothetical protein